MTKERKSTEIASNAAVTGYKNFLRRAATRRTRSTDLPTLGSVESIGQSAVAFGNEQEETQMGLKVDVDVTVLPCHVVDAL